MRYEGEWLYTLQPTRPMPAALAIIISAAVVVVVVAIVTLIHFKCRPH